jgi:hypothetical protein
VVTVAATYTDVAGNAGLIGTSANYAVDSKAPTVAITDDELGTANIAGGSVVYTFQFSEGVTGFTASDVTVVNGAKGTFTALDADTYTLAVTPTDSFEGNLTVDVAAAAALDSAGNSSTAATQSVQAIDTKAPLAPVISSIAENAGGRINASEASNGTPVVVNLTGTGAVANDTLTINWGS